MTFPKVCIFCEQASLSREHIWSKWTRDLIGRSDSQYHSHRSFAGHISRRQDRLEIGRKRTTGGLDTAKVRAVCSHCNNGWMSRLDERVKRSAGPLIQGKPFRIDEATQNLLARWLIMKMMVIEFARDNTASEEALIVSTQRDRKLLMDGLQPDTKWSIWIGHQTSAGRGRSYVRHVIPTDVSKGPSEGFHVLDDPLFETQTFIMRVGSLVAIAICTRWPVRAELEERSRHIIRQIHSSSEPVINWPPISSLSENTLRGLETDPWRFFGF